ncbi:family 16 glycosylhydrolase [Streptococcus suis]|nr:family 16 glycosylhydrolase [Streptococcus suis]
MSKKTVLKWLCATATICSLHAGAVVVSAEDATPQPVATSETRETPAETLPTENQAATPDSTEVTEPVQAAPSETTAGDVESTTEVTEAVSAETVEEVAPALATEYSTNFDSFDERTMAKADWWNGKPFGAVWKPDKVKVENGVMTLTLDQGTDVNAPVEFISGEWRTQDFFHYGTYEVSMKPIKNPGTVSSFFTYTGPSDNNPWDEVDIEFLGKDTTKIQFNYFTNGHGEHEYVYDLGFDASEAFHTYAFDWQKDYITWYVDGKAVHTATDNIPVTPGRIMMNAWPGTGVDDWLQAFDGKTPLVASYDWMRYTATEPVTLEQPPVVDDKGTGTSVTPPAVDDKGTETPNTPPVVDDKGRETSDVESPVDNDKNPERKPEANTDKSDKKSTVTDKTPTTQGAVATLPKTGTKENASLTILGFLSLVAGLVLLPLRKNHH